MSKQNINLKRRERQLERLAQGEANVFERLLSVRTDLSSLLAQIDRLAVIGSARPTQMAGSTFGMTSLRGVIPFPRARTKK
jgi:hypothetical protein